MQCITTSCIAEVYKGLRIFKPWRGRQNHVVGREARGISRSIHQPRGLGRAFKNMEISENPRGSYHLEVSNPAPKPCGFSP